MPDTLLSSIQRAFGFQTVSGLCFPVSPYPALLGSRNFVMMGYSLHDALLLSITLAVRFHALRLRLHYLDHIRFDI